MPPSQADSVVLVTDSTAMLPSHVAAQRGIVVVPLQVVIGARSYEEGAPEATPQTIADALREWTPVSTSRPGPAVFLEAYQQAAQQGAESILSIHLSGEVSGTFESAQLAAREAGIPVLTVDTRQLGFATGYAVLTAADVLAAGGSAEDAAAAARTRAAATTSLFYVDTLEYLRRGGRIGAAAALIGSALAVKPLLALAEGRVSLREKVRTSSRALSRLEELAVEAAGDCSVDVAVAHLSAADRADVLVGRLAERLAVNLEGREVDLGEVGAVLGAHVGPGMVAVVVAPR
ncbi:DegV family protein [Nocardioides mesophilus]|uniref:DegV family protein n=1 Tax=Nocardioides mesophilus TaxID=433659 RepID=A0A7G9RCN9_9ACTN|nr:DegV family protein [Nocardioides mesophilus]QNN53364.1 DegV family protein [Nocardioides mesophilus]